jgi:hypothetical protein
MHTPGPWRAGTKNQRFMNLVYAHDGGILVAEVNTSAPEPGERESNAQLIAAAPDLLEGAEMILNALAWEEKHSGTTYNGADTLRAAVAKAKGAQS